MVRGYAFVDWDDTLAENIAHFNRAEQQMSHLMAEALGLEPGEVFAHGRALDLEMASRLGLVRASFSLAWTRCYDELSARLGRPADPGLRQQVWALADAAYDQEQTLVPGAATMLQWLDRHGFELTVWTAGDPATQLRKVERSGLGAYLDRRVVVPKKTPGALAQALEGRPRERAFVIGNSASSDIAPALAVGILALHIPVETWAYDDSHLDENHPLYVRLGALDQVPGVLGPRFGLNGQEVG